MFNVLGAWKPTEGVDANASNQPTAPSENSKVDSVVPGYEQVPCSGEGIT